MRTASLCFLLLFLTACSTPEPAAVPTIDHTLRAERAKAARAAADRIPDKSAATNPRTRWQWYYNTPNTMFYDTNGDGHCDKLVEDEAFGTDGFRTVKTDTDFDGRFDTLLREGGFAYSADKRDIEEAVPQIRVWRDSKSR